MPRCRIRSKNDDPEDDIDIDEEEESESLDGGGREYEDGVGRELGNLTLGDFGKGGGGGNGTSRDREGRTSTIDRCGRT